MTIGSQAAVGSFVLGGFILSVGAIVLFGKTHFFHPAVHASIVFEGSISGLAVGAPVTFRGVHVGAVDSIEVLYDAQTHEATIPVTVELEPGAIRVKDTKAGAVVTLPTTVAKGLRASLNIQSFVTGQSEIDLDFDLSTPAILHVGTTKYQEIPVRKSGIEKVKDQISQLPLRELTDNANATLKSLRILTRRLDDDVPPLIASVKVTSDQANATLGIAAKTITELQGRMDIALAGISRLVVDVDRQLGQRGAELHVLLASTNQTVVQAQDVLTDFKAIASQRGAARANIESTLRDLAAATASLRGLASDVQRSPQLLLTGRRP